MSGRLYTLIDEPESPPHGAQSAFDNDSSAASDCLEVTRRASCRIADLLNNSLTSIQGFVSLAQDNLGRGLVRSEHLAQIAEAAERGAGLARQLLLFGEPQFGVAVAVDTTELLSQLRADLGSQTDATFEFHRTDDAPLPQVLAAPDAIRECLRQILDNAQQATSGGGSVAITSSLHTIPTDADHLSLSAGEYVSIAIDDDGIGMSPEVARSAFDPFFSSPEHARSRGLGLSIVRQLMQQAGGQVDITSSPNRGTTVTLLFPALSAPATEKTDDVPKFQIAPIPETMLTPAPTEQPAATTRPSTNRRGASGGKETILVVEDEEMVRDLVKRSLGYLGYNVIDACNGEEGLAVGRQRSDEIDMVFTDIVMPRMSGPEMVAKMTADELDLPVLYTTGFTDNKRLLDNGEIREGVNLLPKPYTTKVLANRIREVLDAAVA